MTIDFNGTPVVTPASHEGFVDFFFDTNSDTVPDQISFTETDNGVTYTATAKLIGWTNLSSTNLNTVTGETLTSTDPLGFFTGSGSNLMTLAMPSYFMGSSANQDIEFSTNITINTFSPADGATGVAVGSDIVLTFNEAIQAGIGNIVITNGTDTRTIAIADSTQVTINGNTLTINPTTDLTNGLHYFVTFSDDSIKDMAGNSYAGNESYGFTMSDFPSPPTFFHRISGSVTFWKTGAAIPDVTSTLVSSIVASESMATGADGLYQHINMADGTYALTNDKVSGTAEGNAIKANDALAALKIAVGMNPNADGSSVSPYQYLAADVNKDGQVKAADALNILKMAVQIITAPEKEWLFVPESVGSETMSRTNVVWPDNPIPVILDVDQELHIIGIVKGDVNGSWV
jgi:hypothetical protein